MIYPNLGYDEMYFIDSFNQENIIRKYITDRELYDKIIQRYENRTSHEKLFLMGITMQNHGGYVQTYENFTEECYKVGRSYTDANQYISLVRESDDALKELIDYFSKVEEPVEIVFFGDHQPSLNKKFYSLLNGKGLTNLTVEERTNLYTVPFAIWTNYDSPEETMERTSLNYLSTMTLQRAGIELPPYYQFLADLRQKIPAIHANDYFSNTRQKMISVEDAKGEEKAWIQAYQGLQYNSMFDKAHRSKLFFPYIDKEGLN